ncbi:MAG TPA: Calx-beta domain-containing protein [Verrucomicrobiae bacterium]|jgi:hypothetical protein
MKFFFFKGHLKTVEFLVLLLLAQSLSAAVVTFTNTPSAVSNTYNGPITLQIGGIPTGDTVVVQKFLDLNTNGVVDPSDYLVQQFTLTDGQAGMVIGGVTNFNVPGDLNSSTGAITAQLNFQNGDFVQNIVGKYLLVLSSPVGHFTPITNSFSVTNFPYTQSIGGNVVSNGTSTTLPNAIVLLFPPPNPNSGLGHPVGATVANNAGGYSMAMPPGNYLLFAVKSNFVANVSTPPIVTLGGSSITTNLSLAKATANISGKFVDANNTSIILPGVFAPVVDNDLIAVCFTDTNGNYSARVSSGTWSVGSDSDGLIVHGYVGYENDPTNVSSGKTGVNVGFAKATALFYGNVSDTLGNPLAGIAVEAYDNNNNVYQQDGYTDTNGNYVVGAVGGLDGNDPWNVDFDFGGPANYVFPRSVIDQNGGTNISVGQAVQVNFTGILATNHITGNVQFNGANVVGVQVNAYATIGGNSYQAQMDTDANGNYSLNVANGNWNVNVYDCGCSDGDSLNNILNTGNYQDPGSQNVTINNSTGTANFVVPSCDSVQILTTTLPTGTLNVGYDQFLQASSCDNNFTWTLNSGTLPPGLHLDTFGELFGTPTTNGTFNFSVHVSDNGNSTNQSLSLTINSPMPTISSPVVLGNGQFQFSLSGNAGNYYTIEFSTNLINWVPLLITNPPNSQPLYLDLPTTNKAGFYRAYESGVAVGQSDFSFGSDYSGTPVIYAYITDGIAVIPITRTNGLTTSVCVNYSTSGGTAIGGCDYTPVSGTLCFGADVTSNSISIPISLGCQPTNQSATVNLQLSDTNGNNVLSTVLVIQRPKPILAVYPTSLTIYVPGNCGPSITISNAGPQGSVLNYTLADVGALSGYLNFNDQGPVSPASGSLQSGESADVSITVLDEFATNWIGGTLTTAPSIYTPGAANYVKYPLSVTITPGIGFSVAPVTTDDEYYFVELSTDTNGYADEIYGSDGTINQTVSSYSTVSASGSVNIITTVNSNSISMNGSMTASVTEVTDYQDQSYSFIRSDRYFTLTCNAKVSITGTFTAYGKPCYESGAGCGLYYSASSPVFPELSPAVFTTTNANQIVSYTGILQAGNYVFQGGGDAVIEGGFNTGCDTDAANCGAAFNCTLMLTP